MLLKPAAIVRSLPFAIYIFFLIFDNQLANFFALVLPDCRWLYAIKVTLVAYMLSKFWRHFTELHESVKLNANLYYISIFAGVFVFIFWIAPYPSWAMTADSSGFSPTRADGRGLDIPLLLMRMAGAALVVPLMEELFWRSFLMRWFQNKNFLSVNPATIGLFAFLSTAILFALEHSLWLAGLLAGLVFGGLYKLTRSLWAPIIAHAVTNGLLGIWVVYTENWRYW